MPPRRAVSARPVYSAPNNNDPKVRKKLVQALVKNVAAGKPIATVINRLTQLKVGVVNFQKLVNKAKKAQGKAEERLPLQTAVNARGPNVTFVSREIIAKIKNDGLTKSQTNIRYPEI